VCERFFCVGGCVFLFVFWVLFLFLVVVFGCVWVGFGVLSMLSKVMFYVVESGCQMLLCR